MKKILPGCPLTVFPLAIYLLCLFYALPAIAGNADNTDTIDNADDRYGYLGIIAGVGEPVIKSFKHKKTGAKINLKRSGIYGGKIGYSFYPQMAVELMMTHQPRYRLSYNIPEQNTELNMTIQSIAGSTKVSANLFMVNLIYELQQIGEGFYPHINLGAGISKITIKSSSGSWRTPVTLGPLGNQDITVFKITKNTINCFTWQFGGGISKALYDNFRIDLSALIQVVQNVKIKYENIEKTPDGFLKQRFITALPIKKTIGIGEFTLGFTYRLPF